uniref:C-type lectin domain-containing protein n=1 Tax=Steinernema glaseri TaxID=37863 RepID=A0A1I8AFC1_9BILA
MKTTLILAALFSLAFGCSCPEGWSYLRITDQCYRYFDDPKNFEGAKAACAEQGAYLTDIQSEEENTFVQAIAAQGRSGNWGIQPWIGGFTDTAVQNIQGLHWQWADGMVMNYTNWCPGDPNSWWERCVHMVIDDCPVCGSYFQLGCWNNLGCHNLVGYICKRPTVSS